MSAGFRLSFHPRFPPAVEVKGYASSQSRIIEPNPLDKRRIRRNADGQFTTDQVDIGRSLSADRRQHSKTPAAWSRRSRRSTETQEGAISGVYATVK